MLTIVVSGNLDNIYDLVKQTSNIEPRYVSNGKDFVILVIKTSVSCTELKDFLAENGRYLIVTEMGEHGSAFFDDQRVAECLFEEEAYKYSGETINDILSKIEEPSLAKEVLDVDSLTKEEAMFEIDKLLGVSGKDIDNDDVELIKRLSKLI